MTCKDVVKERGLDKITVEDLVQVSWYHYVGNICPFKAGIRILNDLVNILMSSFQEVAPKGSQMVPDEIRKELLRDIKKFLEEQAED